MAYLIGVDGGTESIRAIVFDLEGRPKGSHASAYQTQFPKPSWAEQNPEDWWRCMGESVRGAVNAAGIRVKDVLALCVDTTCCSVVAVDPDGKPLRPAMIWMDVRSAAEAADVAASGDPALRINRRSRPGVRRVDDPEIAVDEAQPAGTVPARGAYLRIPGLHQLAPDRALGCVTQQHVGALALPEPRRRPAAVAARQAGPRRPRAEVAAGDHPARRRHRSANQGCCRSSRPRARHSGGARRRGCVHRCDRSRCDRAWRDGADHRLFAPPSRHRGKPGSWARHLGHLYGCGLSRQAGDRRWSDLDRLYHRLVQAPLRGQHYL